MDCNTPTDILFSFAGFSRRGGKTGPHADGWGLAFFEGKAARVFLDPAACADSPLATFLGSQSIKTLQAVAHIRKRTWSPATLANTHPFQRELWGRSWVFAHNGSLRGIKKRPLRRFEPIGTTDSEHAFCWMLEQLHERFPASPQEGPSIWEALAELGGDVARLGTFNFLLGNGRHLFARCDTKLCYIVRKYPFGKATLADDDLSIDFSTVTTPRDRVAVIATEPLTRDERWHMGEPATLWVFRHGRVVATLPSGVPRPPRRRSPVRASRHK